MIIEEKYSEFKESRVAVTQRATASLCEMGEAAVSTVGCAKLAHQIFAKAGSSLALPAAVGAPFSFYDFGKQCHLLSQKNADTEDKIAAVGEMCNDVYTVASTVESLTRFLVAFEIIQPQAFLPPLQIACGLFSAVNLGFEAKALANTVQFGHHLDVSKVTDRALTRILGKGERPQIEKLDAEQLKTRVKHKIASRSLAIVAAAITIIAAICLLIPPISFIAFALTAVAAGVTFSKIVFDKVTDDRWAKLLEKTET